jgi:hypothetical protein
LDGARESGSAGGMIGWNRKPINLQPLAIAECFNCHDVASVQKYCFCGGKY